MRRLNGNSMPQGVAKPRPVRMPTSSDPSVLAAGARAKSNMLRRGGRASTILTEMTRGLTGSGGRLGA